GLILAALWLAGRILKEDTPLPWRLGYALTPLAGLSIFLGLSSLTLSMLKAEHIELVDIPELRAGLLILAYVWSASLLWRLLIQHKVARWRQLAAFTVITGSASLVGLSWVMMFYIW
ncbi:MAG: 4Fe-4S binding protein, partial [Nitrospirae bacterium]|nr:4Fe-4S binding protein [Nitrospirota bacterium]